MKRTALGALLAVTVMLACGGCPVPSLSGGPAVTLSVQNAMIAEGYGTVTVTATLVSPALRPVTVDLTFGGTAEFDVDYQASATSITIPAGQTSGSITLEALNDDIYESNETILVGIAGPGPIGNAARQQVIARIQDDGIPPVVSLGLSGSPLVENGGVATVTATLSRRSSLDTTVSLGFSGTAATTDYARSAAEIVIPAGATTGTITLTGVDDDVYEGDETVIVDITGVTNGKENGAQRVIATIQENDAQPAATLSLAGSPLAENGGVATVTVSLSRTSVLPVTVNLEFAGSAGAADYTRSAAQVVIAAGATTGTITLTGTDDSIDEADETIVVDIATVVNGTEDGAQQVTATIADDDAAPTVTLSADPLTLAEDGGTSTVTATLSAVSGQSVVVDLAFDGTATNPADYRVSGSQITVAPGSTTGSVTITAEGDATPEGNKTVIASITGVTNGTENGEQSVTLQITDNETADVTVSPLAITVAEGGAGVSFDVVLNVQPTGDVTITLTGDSQVELSPATLTFTAANWNQAQSVTVTAAADTDDEDPYQGTISLAAAGGGYDAVAINSVTVDVIDDDRAAGAPVTESNGDTEVIEPDGTDTYTVVLAAQPTADVTLAIAVDNGYVTVDKTALTFTSANWDEPQTVTITVVDNPIAAGARTSLISHTLTSSDTRYNWSDPSAVTVHVGDKDVEGVDVSASTVAVTEGGASADYTIVLASQPTANVVITVTPDMQVDLGSGAGVAVVLTFTDANWSTPQTVSVTAVDDSDVEGDHTGTITHAATSADPKYTGIAIIPVTANITDNE